MKINRKNRWTLMVLPLIALLSGCISNESPSLRTPSSNQKVLNWPLGDDLKTLDPALSTDRNAYSVLTLASETLYQFNFKKIPSVLEPLLAEALPRISADGRTYTIRIKKGVFFTDDPAFPNGRGRELKAQDFVYSWKRLFLPRLAASRRSIFEDHVVGMKEFKDRLLQAKGAPELARAFESPVEGLSTPDDYTLRIQLNGPFPLFPSLLTQLPTAAIPREAIARYGDDEMTSHLVGTGPFVLKSYTRGSKIVMIKNPHFRGETLTFTPEGKDPKATRLPFLDEVRFHIQKEEQTGWLNFLKGQLDIYGIPKDESDTALHGDDLSSELKGKGIQLEKTQQLSVKCVVLNFKVPHIGSNVLLRRAISSAIDRKRWIQLFLNGHGVPATGLIPLGIGEKPQRNQLPWDFDVNKAKDLLAKAGFPNGAGLPVLKLSIETGSLQRQEGEFFQQLMKEIGVQVELDVNSGGAFITKMSNGTMEMFLATWLAVYPDVEAFLKRGYGKFVAPGPNDSNWIDARFDPLYEKIVATVPSLQRAKWISEAEDLFLNEVVAIPIYHPITYSLQQPWLLNNKSANPIALNGIKYLDVGREHIDR
jgi:ABC-type transport system substrate-binding protein